MNSFWFFLDSIIDNSPKVSKQLIDMQLVFFMLHQNPTSIICPTPGTQPGPLLIFLGHWAVSLRCCLVERPVCAHTGKLLNSVVSAFCSHACGQGRTQWPAKWSLQHGEFGKNKWNGPITVTWDTMPRGGDVFREIYLHDEFHFFSVWECTMAGLHASETWSELCLKGDA